MAEEHEEIEVIDVTLSESEIDEMIAHLMELKEHKTNVQFPLASDLDLSVTFTHDDENEGEKVESDKQMQEVKQ
ncbi:hypothetical protein FJZ21_03395 [Candidatus Pacearchaeota archaeon]|nr:hypothetical protein [Candidatus Pacearchaeota archaeon]